MRSLSWAWFSMTGGCRERKDLSSDADTQARTPTRDGEGEVGQYRFVYRGILKSASQPQEAETQKRNRLSLTDLRRTSSISHQSQTSSFQNCLIINTCHLCHPVVAPWNSRPRRWIHTPTILFFIFLMCKHYSEFLLPSSKTYLTNTPSQPWWRLSLILNSLQLFV